LKFEIRKQIRLIENFLLIFLSIGKTQEKKIQSAMNGKRIFTGQEMKEMGTRTLDLVFKAIDAGNKDKAKELANRMYKEFNYLHDGYMFWVSGLLTQIYKKYGIDAVEAAEREAHTIEARVVFKPPEDKNRGLETALLKLPLKETVLSSDKSVKATGNKSVPFCR
jgi:hypothetical protein